MQPDSSVVPIIETRNLEKHFGHKKALRGVNLTVYSGDFLTLFGPNGAGKTTFLRTISSIVRASSGEVLFEGRSMGQDTLALREKLGFVSHNSLLYEDLTARENLVFYGRMYGVPELDARIDELLRKVGLYHRQHDVVRTFSRGMLQRLAIARAVLHDPPVLLLDEPYTGLDIQAIRILDDLLEELKDGSRTFIMTSHDIGKGFEHATRVAILAEGKIVLDKKKEEVTLDEFTAEFWRWVKEKDLVS